MDNNNYYYQQYRGLNNNNVNVNNGVENHHQGLNNKVNVNSDVENHYQGLNNSVNVNNGVENHYYQQYQGLNNIVNVNNVVENHYQQYQGLNNIVSVNNGVESHYQQYQGLNNIVNVNNGVENHYQQYQGLNNIVNVNNGVESHYQQYQGLNNNIVNVNNGVDNHFQQYQGLNNNINVNNGVENDYQQDQSLNNGGVEYLDSFPAGYRFLPTDHELIGHYLMKKVNDEELPPNRIYEVRLYDLGPKDLTDNYRPDDRNIWFFFTSRDRKYKNGSRPDRAAGNGYWKATGADKPIKNLRGGLVGFKKALVYYVGKPPNGVKTNWIMHEYMVNNPPAVVRGPNNNMQLDKWVLCKIYHRDGKTNDAVDDQSSSPATPIQSTPSVGSDIPSQDNLQIVSSETQIQSYVQDDRQILVAKVEDNVRLNGLDVTSQAQQIDQNADDFLSSSLDPNSWQHRAMYRISNTNVQVNSSTTYFNNPVNVQVNSSVPDFNHSGYLSNTHPDNNSVLIDEDDLQNLLYELVPHDGVITQQWVPAEIIAQQSPPLGDVIAQQLASFAEVIPQQSSTVGGVIAQNSAPAENVAQQSVSADVVAQQSGPGTGVVSEQSATKDEVAGPFSDPGNIETMAYLKF